MKSLKSIPVTLLVLSLILQISVVFASSENWVEVIRFTGETEDVTTEVFTCDNVEWRIRWSYSRRPDGPAVLQFRFYIYESEEMIIEEELVEFLFPEEENSGTLYLNQSGSFYLNIHNDGFNYNVVVEQNINSIPKPENNWVEVARFNGTIWPESTEHFKIDYFDWRIKWSYTPRLSELINPYIFRLDVKNASDYIVELLFASNQIAGTLNMNQTGEYYLYIDPMHAENYSITVEQNIDSIPEFPSWTLIAFFVTVSFAMILIRNKISKKKGDLR